jgi:hypothetical protein
MVRYLKQISLALFFPLLGCGQIQPKDLVGFWVNHEEGCSVELSSNGSFTSSDLPVDVVNQNYLTFNKGLQYWQGEWNLEGHYLKWNMKDGGYYFMAVDRDLLSREIRLEVRLLDESGGNMIFLGKL